VRFLLALIPSLALRVSIKEWAAATAPGGRFRLYAADRRHGAGMGAGKPAVGQFPDVVRRRWRDGVINIEGANDHWGD